MTGQESQGHEQNHQVKETYDDFKHGKHSDHQWEMGPTGDSNRRDVEIKVNRFKEALLAKGMQGILGVCRQFRIYDENKNGTLEFPEFVRALTEYNIQVEESDLQHLFRAFDFDKDGHIQFNELMKFTTGQMSEYRSDRVELAWRRINTTQAPAVKYADVVKHFNSSRHPSVTNLESSEEGVTAEFNQNFAIHHGVWNDFADANPVTREEFFNYFRILSVTIQIDAAFNQYMVGVWNADVRDLQNTQTAGKNPDHEFKDHRANWKYDFHRSLYGDMDHKTFEHNVEEVQKPSNKAEVSEGMVAAGVSNWPHLNNDVTQSNVQCLGGPKLSQMDINEEDEALADFRRALFKRGARGIVGLRRSFNICDDDGSKSLNWEEFWKALNDFRIQTTEEEARHLFQTFDLDGNGSVNFEEFLRTVTGKMNENRKEVVRSAFKKFDVDGSGNITIEDMKAMYDTTQHPEVTGGKKDEDTVLMEFLDTFDMHHRIRYKGQVDHTVSLDEFLEYYNSISCLVEDDEYFETMINNAWGLKRRNYSRGWVGY